MAKKAEGGQPTMKKTEAVKAALDAGKDKPIDGSNWIKAELGMDVSPQQFSTYKSLAKNKGGKTGNGRKKARRGGRPKKAVTSTGGGTSTGNGMVALDDLEAAKALVAKVGADQARRLVGLFE